MERWGTVTDNSNWQSPGSATPEPAPAAFPPPESGQSGGSGESGPGQHPGAAWTPPPKPGLVPLRPLGFGTLLGASFQVLRRNPKASFGSALLIQAFTTVVTTAVVGFVAISSVVRIANAAPGQEDAITAGSVAAIIAAVLVSIVLSFGAVALLQGIIVLEVARGTLGEKLTLGSLWRQAVRRLWPLVLWTLMYSAAVFLAIGVVALVVVVLVLQGSVALTIVGVVLGLLLGLGLVVLFFWLFTKLSLTPSVIVLENSQVIAALRRSWRLTTGYFWRTLGAQLLVAVIIQIAMQVVLLPVSLIFGIGTGLFFPTGTQSEDDFMGAVVPALVLNGVVLLFTIVFSAIGAVAQSACSALIYIDLRMRKEGLDLELARFVENRSAAQSGEPDALPDPYDATAPSPSRA